MAKYQRRYPDAVYCVWTCNALAVHKGCPVHDKAAK